MVLEYIILSELTQSQKNTYGMHSLILISPEVWNIQDTFHTLNEAQEERRPKCSHFDPA